MIRDVYCGVEKIIIEKCRSRNQNGILRTLTGSVMQLVKSDDTTQLFFDVKMLLNVSRASSRAAKNGSATKTNCKLHTIKSSARERKAFNKPSRCKASITSLFYAHLPQKLWSLSGAWLFAFFGWNFAKMPKRKIHFAGWLCKCFRRQGREVAKTAKQSAREQKKFSFFSSRVEL